MSSNWCFKNQDIGWAHYPNDTVWCSTTIGLISVLFRKAVYLIYLMVRAIEFRTIFQWHQQQSGVSGDQKISPSSYDSEGRYHTWDVCDRHYTYTLLSVVVRHYTYWYLYIIYIYTYLYLYIYIYMCAWLYIINHCSCIHVYMYTCECISLYFIIHHYIYIHTSLNLVITILIQVYYSYIRLPFIVTSI